MSAINKNFNNTDKDPNKKVENPFSIIESPENFFFFTGIALF
jgi:hypothetical protein